MAGGRHELLILGVGDLITIDEITLQAHLVSGMLIQIPGFDGAHSGGLVLVREFVAAHQKRSDGDQHHVFHLAIRFSSGVRHHTSAQ